MSDSVQTWLSDVSADKLTDATLAQKCLRDALLVDEKTFELLLFLTAKLQNLEYFFIQIRS